MWLVPLALAIEDPEALVHRVQPDVAALRGLEFAGEVPVRVWPRHIALPELRTRMQASVPPERWKAEGLALRAFGLADPDYDHLEALLGSLGEHIGGFWEPQDQLLVIVPRETGFPLDSVVRHELVHALQDTHFDIGIKTDPTLREDDLLLAFECLMEGDASFADLLATDPAIATADLRETLHGVWPESPVFTGDHLPPSAVESAMAPYTLGTRFVQQLHRTAGWDGVNAALQHPPLSTENILHPERPDRPTRVRLAIGNAAGPGFTEVYDNTQGELRIALFFRQAGFAREAWDAASGWDGDRYAVLEGPDGAVAAVWRTVWDTPQDAAEFAALAERAFAALHRDAVIDTRGDGVVVVLGAPPGTSAKLVKRAWKARLAEVGDVEALVGRRPTEARPPSTAP